MTTAADGSERRIFSFQEAQDLLPFVKKITSKTIAQVNDLLERLELLTEEDPEFEEVRGAIDTLVRSWAEALRKLGCDVKGLWLVDFDNGQGYYCWSFPEDQLDHFHGYDEDFASRTLIC